MDFYQPMRPYYIKQLLKKYYKPLCLFFALITLVLSTIITVTYYRRNTILRWVVNKTITKAKDTYQLNVCIKYARFNGFTTVAFNSVSVTPINEHQILYIDHLELSIQILPLLIGKLKLKALSVHNAFIHLIKRKHSSNYEFLFKVHDTKQQHQEINLAKLTKKILESSLHKVPQQLDIKHTYIYFDMDTNRSKYLIKSATLKHSQAFSTIIVNSKEAIWHVDGEIDPQQLNLKFYAEGRKVELPFLEKKYALKLNFDTLQTKMLSAACARNRVTIRAQACVKGLLLRQPKLSVNQLVVPEAHIEANFLVGKNFIALDSSSILSLKNVTASPFIKYTLSPQKTYEVSLHMPFQNAQAIFNAFPVGSFEALEGIKLTGQLAYNFRFYLNSAEPDQLKLSSSIQKRNFKVTHWGKVNLQVINYNFIYTPKEHERALPSRVIGPQNPYYTPLNKISPYLKHALLTSEDPSFYTHHGFVPIAICQSIAIDFKNKSFKRGASTISMQLVKNAFLSRQKTICRKLEEMLLVWMIENNHLSTKDRMFEVYLNIIEWGKNIYGIGEAAHYYFNKSPSELTLGESIFLASIVPHPKNGLSFFEPTGQLKRGLHGYFKLIGNIMARRGMIPADTDAYEFSQVRLQENLRQERSLPDSLLLLDSPFAWPTEEGEPSFN